MRRWATLPLTGLLVLGLALSAWANSELHPGSRLFYPLWASAAWPRWRCRRRRRP